jgi:hypothetical protein
MVGEPDWLAQEESVVLVLGEGVREGERESRGEREGLAVVVRVGPPCVRDCSGEMVGVEETEG